MNGTRILSLFICLLLITPAYAQEEQKKTSDAQETRTEASADPQTKEQAKALIKKAFELSRNVTSEKDLDQILSWLGEVNEEVISEKDVAYIATLEGWTLNAKAKRLVDDIERFEKIQKEEEANEALQEAIDTFTAAIEKDDQRVSSYRQRGVLFARQQQFEKAIADFSTAIRIQPDDQSSWFNRAEIRYAQKDYETAVGDYTQAIQLKPDDVQALTGRAHSYLRLGQKNDAIADYQTVTKLLPKDSEAMTNLADAYQVDKQWQAAEDAFRTALELSQENARAYALVAWLYSTCPEESQRKPQIALQAIKRSIKLTGTESAENLEILAAAFAANDQFDLAAKTQQRAIEMSEEADNDQMQARLQAFSSKRQHLQSERKLR